MCADVCSHLYNTLTEAKFFLFCLFVGENKSKTRVNLYRKSNFLRCHSNFLNAKQNATHHIWCWFVVVSSPYIRSLRNTHRELFHRLHIQFLQQVISMKILNMPTEWLKQHGMINIWSNMLSSSHRKFDFRRNALSIDWLSLLFFLHFYSSILILLYNRDMIHFISVNDDNIVTNFRCADVFYVRYAQIFWYLCTEHTEWLIDYSPMNPLCVYKILWYELLLSALICSEVHNRTMALTLSCCQCYLNHA